MHIEEDLSLEKLNAPPPRHSLGSADFDKPLPVDKRTPAQIDADKLFGKELKARSTDNDGDRQTALDSMQKDVAQFNGKGAEYAKAVYAALAKHDTDAGTVPLLELTDGSLKLEDSAKVNANIANSKDSIEVMLTRATNQLDRSYLNLPDTASDAEVEQAERAQDGKRWK